MYFNHYNELCFVYFHSPLPSLIQKFVAKPNFTTVYSYADFYLLRLCLVLDTTRNPPDKTLCLQKLATVPSNTVYLLVATAPPGWASCESSPVLGNGGSSGCLISSLGLILIVNNMNNTTIPTQKNEGIFKFLCLPNIVIVE